jgi:hypothetical protein
MTNLFERLSKERTAPNKKAHQLEGAQKLLSWLMRWRKDTITAREIRIFGPYALRDQKRALDAAKKLVMNGWLIPLPARKHHHYEWQIKRKINTLDPDVIADSPLTLHQLRALPWREQRKILKNGPKTHLIVAG